MNRESLSDTIEILSDAETMSNIKEALERIENGDYGVSIDEVRTYLRNL